MRLAKKRGVGASRLGTPATVVGKDVYVGNKISKIKSLIRKNLRARKK